MFAIDSSVLLAIILNEPGGQQAISGLDGGLLSSVNFSEVITRCLERGVDADLALFQIGRLNIVIVPFTADDARATAELRMLTRHRGLSLGDRACLALALREGVPVMTTDRQWDGLDIGVDIRLIR